MKRIVTPALVVLVGPSGSGKSAWAAENFASNEIVSSDELRAAVGLGPYDQKASKDAFAMLDAIVAVRARRKLTTVIDTLGLDEERRRSAIELAQSNGMAVYAIGFETPASVCRARNKQRFRRRSCRARSTDGPQRRNPSETRDSFVVVLVGGDQDHVPGVRWVPEVFAIAADAAARQAADPSELEFGLQLSKFEWEDGSQSTPERLTALVRAAEDAGFATVWVMDHFIQIPQVGRVWDDMLESYTALVYLAAASERRRLRYARDGGRLPQPGPPRKDHRDPRRGRAICGIGAGWFEREVKAYGYESLDTRTRLDLLEDALRVLPLMWGPGSPSFEGKVISVPEATCYPRPIQDHIPMLVGGQGEKRTLRLVAELADMCNLFGDATKVKRKIEVLHRHCTDVGRDPTEITVTHLGPAAVAADARAVTTMLERLTPADGSRDATAATINAGTVDDHVGRFRGLAEAGVQHAIVYLPENTVETVGSMAPVIAAFG